MKNKVLMEHSEYSRRYKSVEEIQAMIGQYESQLETCNDEQARSLLNQVIGRLRRLIKSMRAEDDRD